MDAAPMTIADQLQRIQHHAESLSRKSAAKATMHRGSRHQYTASELLQMRGLTTHQEGAQHEQR